MIHKSKEPLCKYLFIFKIYLFLFFKPITILQLFYNFDFYFLYAKTKYISTISKRKSSEYRF